jgi:hypothetical protein
LIFRFRTALLAKEKRHYGGAKLVQMLRILQEDDFSTIPDHRRNGPRGQKPDGFPSLAMFLLPPSLLRLIASSSSMLLDQGTTGLVDSSAGA